ncbi:hypothetical protein EWM62_18230 [Mucilaginibacter terrigena]|uniref:DUF4252 domain-containing protein n=1 Tax=Mucilaginibacter terrigena TaxID=2492395 RepID=A0A4V1ZBD0_9SPHI|nr:hypothetical protein [Mucilaginibacter terrigena]RYU86146.1 hypothetical protein EWM62_18230 [Mucilaginibacter terrigena]
MKNIILIIALSIISATTCKAQIAYTSDLVKVNLPNGTFKLNKQQVDAISNVKSVNKIVKVYPHNLYKKDNILLGFNNVNQDSINNNLPGVKKFIDQLYLSSESKPNRTYESMIKNTYNNNHALIVRYDIKNTGHIRFYCQNASKTLILSGKIEYSKLDSAKANSLLEEVLKNIRFTK